MRTVLVIGPAGDPAVPEAFQRLEIRAEEVVREQLERRVCSVRFVDAVRTARQLNVPILGICRGTQFINVAFGGTLIPDIADWAIHHGRTPETIFIAEQIAIAPSSRLAVVYQNTALTVRNGHHQAVARVGRGLVAAAAASDGIVEADPVALRQLFDAYVGALAPAAMGAGL